MSILLEIISDCVMCEAVADLFPIVHSVSDLLQAEHIIFLSSNTNLPKSVADIREINISYNTTWLDIYKAYNYIKIDPIFNVGLSGLLYWQDVYKTLPPDKEFHYQAKQFGLENGFSHILSGKTTFGLISLSDSKLRKSQRNISIINYIAPHLHQLTGRLVHKIGTKGKISLTAREREVLLWTMHGKTNWEISVILGIGSESIKSYIKNVLNKLDAINRTHAVAIALQNDLLAKPF